ncbi:MAG: GvpL/GvpF family gas vesicle protein [Solirubrobacteraceae bacterium]
MATPADRLHAALAELAVADLDALIAEARQEARARVRAQLVDVLAAALLDQAGRRLAPEPPKPLAPPAPTPRAAAKPAAKPVARPAVEPSLKPAAEPGAEQTVLYAYCVIAADTALPADLPSIDPAYGPRLICHDDLAAVVSEVPTAEFGEERLRANLADMEWLERTARTHEVTLEAIGREATLIPMRLCSLYQEQAGVVAMLELEAPALSTGLGHLEGKTEWGVKAFATLPPPQGSVAVPGDSGTDYLQRRRRDRHRRQDAVQQQHEICVAIHERLAGAAADALTSPSQRPEVSGHPGQMMLNGVYLVEDEQRSAFLRLVDQLQGDHAALGIELQATGPWPAYNFVPGTIGAAW